MDHQFIARILLATYCGLQGFATALIDLGRTHATHPRWIGHARFHVVWQTCTVVALSIVAIGLTLALGPLVRERFYLVVLLSIVPIFSFFAALLTRRLYGGTLSDVGGMPRLKMRMGDSVREIDLNSFAEIIAAIALLIMVGIFRSA